MTKLDRTSDFLFEAMMLKRTPRSGYQFLGNGRESVAEHSYGVCMIAFTLVRMNGQANGGRTLELALFHDLAEARTGDQNYVNKRYVKVDEEQAMDDATQDLSFGPEVKELWAEWRAGKTLEAQLAIDADQLDMIIELRRLEHLGNTGARDWLFYAEKRLKTEEGRKLYQTIVTTDPTQWWFEKRDDYWVHN